MRDSTIDICKGVAIILMVAGHAEVPTLFSNFIYVWHMPLFFIASGWFFTAKTAADPWRFCVKRFRGLYVPFLTWSLVFLLTHNLWFHVGLLSEEFGNWEGGVTHPYSWREFLHRLMLIVTSMSGYDEFMAGAFWFFRGLLVASLVFMALYLLAGQAQTQVTSSPRRAAWLSSPLLIPIAVCLAAYLFQAFRLGNGFTLKYLPNGGLREVWGVFFIGIGVLLRALEGRWSRRWWLALICLGVVVLGATQHWCGMNNRGQLRDLLTLPLTGTAGFVMCHYFATKIGSLRAPVAAWLAHAGRNSLYIFIFHIISFKPVSALKAWWYDLDPGQIGCHMVIHHRNHEDLFWVLYTVVGVALPLLGLALVRKWKERRNLQAA